MNVRQLRAEALQWFGVFGAGLAWAMQHVAGIAVTLAACDRAGSRWDVAVNGLTIAISATAAVIAVLAGASAVLTFRSVRAHEKDDPPPGGRMHFLGIVGMTVSPLFLCIILMSGSGVLSLTACQQS